MGMVRCFFIFECVGSHLPVIAIAVVLPRLSTFPVPVVARWNIGTQVVRTITNTMFCSCQSEVVAHYYERTYPWATKVTHFDLNLFEF